jgi:hypothetical protein
MVKNVPNAVYVNGFVLCRSPKSMKIEQEKSELRCASFACDVLKCALKKTV